jgi:hypothetical protein
MVKTENPIGDPTLTEIPASKLNAGKNQIMMPDVRCQMIRNSELIFIILNSYLLFNILRWPDDKYS